MGKKSILTVALFVLFSTMVIAVVAVSFVTAGVNLVVATSKENPSEEFKKFFWDFNNVFKNLYKAEKSEAYVQHEFCMMEVHTAKEWMVIIHPLVGMKYLDRLNDKEFSAFTWRIEGKFLKNAAIRREKAAEAAKWLINKVRQIDDLYFQDLKKMENRQGSASRPAI